MTSAIPLEEQVVFRGNEIVLQLEEFITIPVDHSSTQWKFTSTVNLNETFTITVTANGVVSDYPISIISYASLVELRIALDRTKDYYLQVRANEEEWSEQELLDHQPRMISAKHRSETEVTPTTTGATVSTPYPRWTELRSGNRVVITNQVYVDEPASNKPTESTQGRRTVINNNTRNRNKSSITEYTPSDLVVSPSSDFESTGAEGGPFSPSSITYTLSNTGSLAIEWSVEKNNSWVSLSKMSGVLLSGETDSVIVSFNAAALTSDTYTDTLTFTNNSGGLGTTTRSISLEVISAYTPMTAAHATSGFAPLPVFFDTLGSTGVVQPEDGDVAKYYYRWDYGDESSGDWTLGRPNADSSYPSKNQSFGHIGSHVYEAPGTYTATLHVLDDTGATHHYSETITVTEFSGTTYYVKNGGSDSDDGLSDGTAFATFKYALTKRGANVRILFNRGDTFDVPIAGYLTSSGPGILGTYGTGAKPIINAQGNSNAIQGDDAVNGWRVMDLSFTGPESELTSGYWYEGGMNNSLFLRCDVTAFQRGFICSGMSIHNLFFTDCVFTDSYYHQIYMAGKTADNVEHVAVQGCSFDLTTSPTTHLLRCYMRHSLVQNSEFYRKGYHQIKFCGTINESQKADYCLISDNLLGDAVGGGQAVSIGPENNVSEQWVDNIIVENNIFTGPGTAVASRGADNMTIRNNLCNGIQIMVNTSDPVPGFSTYNNWKLLNNTFYMSTNTACRLMYSDVDTPNLEILNNIFQAPLSSSDTQVFDLSPVSEADISCDYNIWYIPSYAGYIFLTTEGSYYWAGWLSAGFDSHSSNTNAQFVNAASSNFYLDAASPGYDAGLASVYVRDDCYRKMRPLLTVDMGCFDASATTP